MEKSWRLQACPCSGCSPQCPQLSREGAKLLWRGNLVSHSILSSPSDPFLLSCSLFSPWPSLGLHFLVLFQRSSGSQKNCGPSSAPVAHCGTPAKTPGTYGSRPQPWLVFGLLYRASRLSGPAAGNQEEREAGASNVFLRLARNVLFFKFNLGSSSI